MPTYLLDSGDAAVLPIGPLRIRASITGTAAATLEVRTAPGSGTTHVRPQPDFIVLSHVDAPATIAIVAGSGVFGDDASLSLEIDATRAGRADGDRAVLSRVRIGGVREQALVLVERSGDGLVVQPVRSTAEDVVLSTIGAAARAAVSSRIGSTVMPASDTKQVRIAVDASASFRRRIVDGSLADVLELVAGVASVTAAGHGISAAVVASGAPVWRDAKADRLAADLTATLAAEPMSSGITWPAANAGAITYLITDGSAPLPTGAGVLPVVVEAETVWFAGRRTSSPVALIAPPSRGRLKDVLLADRTQLQSVVDALLQPWLAPAPSEERTAS